MLFDTVEKQRQSVDAVDAHDSENREESACHGNFNSIQGVRKISRKIQAQ
jgi:hypothetical protein